MDYEAQLFQVAPWTQEFLQLAKTLNNGAIMRGRTGWLNRGVENPESIYEHCCKVGLAAYHLFGTEEAVALGIIHDFPEIYSRDYTPGEIDPLEKRDCESAIMQEISNILPNGNFWLGKWQDFENRLGIGKQIAELDKICPAIQAVDYLNASNGNSLEQFYPYSRKKVNTPQLVALLDQICLGEIPNEQSAYEVYFAGLDRIML